MNAHQQLPCTWCKGKGYIKKDREANTSKLRWILVISFVAIVALARQFEILHGIWAIIFISLLIVALVVQFGIDILETIGILNKQKATCPHCGGLAANQRL